MKKIRKFKSEPHLFRPGPTRNLDRNQLPFKSGITMTDPIFYFHVINLFSLHPLRRFRSFRTHKSTPTRPFSPGDFPRLTTFLVFLRSSKLESSCEILLLQANSLHFLCVFMNHLTVFPRVRLFLAQHC